MRSGRRRVYVAGLVATGVGAVLCAVAVEPLLFVVGRVVQGGGGAAVLACGLAVLAHRYPLGPDRLHATSVWGASVGLGHRGRRPCCPRSSTSAPAGGRAYWVTAVARARCWSRRACGGWPSPRPRSATGWTSPGWRCSVAAMTLAVSALTQGRNGIDLPTVVLAVLAVVSLAAFVLVERRVAAPLLDPELLAHPRFRAATGGSLVLGAGMIGMASFTPTLVQVGYGRGLWAATLPVFAWAGTGVVTSLLVRTDPAPARGAAPGGAVPGRGRGRPAAHLRTGRRARPCGGWSVPFVVAGAATGVLNALLGREAIASVPPDRAAMGSRRQQHRPLPRRRLRHHAVRDRGDAHRRRPVRRLERRRAGRRRAHPARGRRDRVDRARRTAGP